MVDHSLQYREIVFLSTINLLTTLYSVGGLLFSCSINSATKSKRKMTKMILWPSIAILCNTRLNARRQVEDVGTLDNVGGPKVAWSNVCLLCRESGLDIYHIYSWNVVVIMMLLWLI